MLSRLSLSNFELNPNNKRKTDVIFSEEEVSQHCTKDDCWLIISGGVYDVTSYIPYHPGGEKALLKFAGRDGSENVEFHSSKMMFLLNKYFYIGKLKKKDRSNAIGHCIIL